MIIFYNVSTCSIAEVRDLARTYVPRSRLAVDTSRDPKWGLLRTPQKRLERLRDRLMLFSQDPPRGARSRPKTYGEHGFRAS